jgi:hypothetical protein
MPSGRPGLSTGRAACVEPTLVRRPVLEPDVRWLRNRGSAWSLVAIAFAVTAALGAIVDQTNVRVRQAEERDLARAALRPYADNVAAAIERRVAQVSGIRAFVQSRRDFATLAHEFDSFGAGLVVAGSTLRAIELVRGDRIELIYPAAGNEAALHLDLRNDPRQEVVRDFLRAAATDSIVLSGPLPLKQGQSGLIIRQRVRAPFLSGGGDQVALVVDTRALLAEAGLTDVPSTIALALYDRGGRLVSTTGAPVPQNPERLVVNVRDGRWELRGGPAAGWAATEGLHVLPLRLAITFITLLVTALVFLVAGREERLSRAVEARTASLRDLVEEHRETIARQNEAERALAASEERLRLALSASRTTTFTVDLPSGRMEWLHDGPSVIGLREADQPTASVGQASQFIDPRDRAMVTAAYAEACRAAGKGALEVRTIGADQVSRWIGLTWLSQAGDHGVVHRIVGTVTDITSRKQLEEQFLHSQKMQALGALAGGVAHDFNNLLTVIVGAGQLARMRLAEGAPPEALEEEIDELLSAGGRAALLTSQLLTFSRRQIVQAQHLDAAELVRSMGTMLRRLVGERIRVETALPKEAVPLFADQGQITQVVMNLAVNARDAMPEGGVLRIGLRCAGRPSGPPLPEESLHGERFAVLSISDTGCGIDPSIRAQIFDPFFTTKPVGEGTGLGLSTVYGIVMRLAGTLRVSSESGKGTTIEVYLPLAAAPPAPQTLAQALAGAPRAVGRTVLLVEDDVALRQVAERILKGDGYRVLCASDGEDALRVSRAFVGSIDLLVADVVMPRMGGMELAAVLLSERPALRVLLMSGYARSSAAPAVLANVPFVAKPFRPAELLAAARTAIATP